VKAVVLEALSHHPDTVEGSEVEFYYQEFGSSSINFIVMFWIDFKKEGDYLSGKSEAIMRIKSAFDEAGITIPFPIRTLDFGIKGGEKLSSMLNESPGPYFGG
ncbi:MAG: mechanosensitive ion channel family protein, partial [Bacteroidota bacterium]